MSTVEARSAAADVGETVKTIAVALGIALVLRIFLFEPFTIPSDSMEPAIRQGDFIVVSKFDYGWSHHSIPFSPPLFPGRIMGRGPQRGDIVVFKLPRDGHTDYIKRLIGLPGDRVQLIQGEVYVNGRAIPRIPFGETSDPDAPLRHVTQVRETMANGRSYTTLDEAPHKQGDTTGVYVVPARQYFFMGDNRDNSLDSRWPAEVGVGFVPAENLVGRARFILLAWRGGASLLKPWTWITRFEPGRSMHGLK